MRETMLSRHPRPRRAHAAVGVEGKLYVWGGDGQISATSIDSFSVLSGTWEDAQRFQGSLPEGPVDAAVTSEGKSAYFFGGIIRSPGYSNTLYEFDFSAQQPECRELVPGNPSCAPKKKFGSRMVYFNQKLVVHGGSVGNCIVTDELHVFDLRTSEDYYMYVGMHALSSVL